MATVRLDPALRSVQAVVRYELERAFYLGERTEWELVVDAVGAPGTLEQTDVGVCEIRGCVSGDPTFFCDAEGRHFCE